MVAQQCYGHIKYGRVPTEAPYMAAQHRQRWCQRMLRLCTSSLSDPAGTISAAASPTSTPVRAVKPCDAPCSEAMNGCATTLRTYYVQTRRHRSAWHGRPASTEAVSAHSESLHFQSVRPSSRHIFAASSPTSTPLRAVRSSDAPCY